MPRISLHLQFQITSLISDGITPSPIHHVIPAPEYDGSIVPQTNDKEKATGKNGLWFLDLILPSCLFQFLIVSIFFDIVGLGYRIETLPWHIWLSSLPPKQAKKALSQNQKLRDFVLSSFRFYARPFHFVSSPFGWHVIMVGHFDITIHMGYIKRLTTYIMAI